MLDAGTRLGVYEIVAPLGVGGMGEVYRAKDTRLNRDVAIKVLPDVFVNDSDRLARFQREAQLLAALNHPHIAAIYGLEESDSARFLVLELVEGESLASRLARGAPPIDEATAIALQIIDALEGAHEKGIIHRDLKPANVMVTGDDRVKVLDFGLAKAIEGDARSDLSHSPTLTYAATQAGIILGTAAYMSPEQARGRPADKRTDVWAFGCVFFEMLTGRRAFEGEDVTDTIAAIVRGEPDWDALPAAVPPQIRLLLKRCLERDRKKRITDIGVARFLLTETVTAPQAPPTAAAAGVRPRRLGGVVAGLAIGTVSTALAAWAFVALIPHHAQPVRFAIVPPLTLPLAIQGADRDIAISPDGTLIAYIAGQSERRLVVRAIDRLDAQPLGDITGAREPFFSPDGRWIGYHTSGELKKVLATGGPSITLCRFATPMRSASWSDEGTIVFATAGSDSGLLSVPEGGGQPKALTTPELGHGESDHQFPSFLPGGRAVLFTVITLGALEDAQVAVLDLTTGERKTLIHGGSHAEYVQTGHLVYAASGSLRAVPFDLRSLRVTGDSVPVVEQMMTSNTGAANYAVSRQGTLVYVPGAAQAAPRTLVWVNREGREEPLGVPPRAYGVARVSPDGTRVAVDIRDQEQDIWIWDVARKTLTRLTFDNRSDESPVWTPDGLRVIFNSTRGGGVFNLFRQLADNTGTAERLTTSPNLQVPNAVSRDDRLVYMELSPNTNGDLFLLDREQIRPLMRDPFNEASASLSPDGRWIAYQSLESAANEVYVRPFPNIQDGKWQVSSGGGTRPVWSPDGREIFYLSFPGAMHAVPVETGTRFRRGNPVKLFDTRYFTALPNRSYDIAPDGRFLMVKEAAPSDSTTPASMIVILNWFEELKQRSGRR